MDGERFLYLLITDGFMVSNHTTAYRRDMFLAMVYMVPLFMVLSCDSWHLALALFFNCQWNMIGLLEIFFSSSDYEEN